MQNFARNNALAKILGLAKIDNFAKIAKFLLRLRNFRNLSEIPGIADFCTALPPVLHYISSNHFAFILSLIFGMIDS